MPLLMTELCKPEYREDMVMEVLILGAHRISFTVVRFSPATPNSPRYPE